MYAESLLLLLPHRPGPPRRWRTSSEWVGGEGLQLPALVHLGHTNKLAIVTEAQARHLVCVNYILQNTPEPQNDCLIYHWVMRFSFSISLQIIHLSNIISLMNEMNFFLVNLITAMLISLQGYSIIYNWFQPWTITSLL